MERDVTEEGATPHPLPRQRSFFADGAAPAADMLAPDGADAASVAVTLPGERAATERRQATEAREDVLSAITASVAPPVSAMATAVPVVPVGRLYLTADLRAATGLTRTAMDFYLRAGVVRPAARAESGYLLFDERELAILRRVLEWRGRGIGLREIKARLGRR